MGVEFAGVGGGCIAGRELVAGEAHFAGHFDVAAEGDGGDLVLGVAAPEAEETFAETDGEDLDTDAAEFGDGEVAKLVDENHDAEDDEKLDDSGHEDWGRPRYLFSLPSYARGLAGNHFARSFTRGKICFKHFENRRRGLTGCLL